MYNKKKKLTSLNRKSFKEVRKLKVSLDILADLPEKRTTQTSNFISKVFGNNSGKVFFLV